MESRFGPYEVKHRVGVGGMAEVVLAVEHLPTGLEREVVLKRILPSHAQDPDYAEFFEHEARVALGLQHPNIVAALAFGVIDGVQYLAMELVRGETLLGMLRAAHKAGRKLDVGAVVRIGTEIAAALAHTHSARDPSGKLLRVIHRDVSPQNILVSHEGAVKLADFGVARTSEQAFRTQTGVVKGKFAYLAPEQVLHGRDYDHRVDLFALGVVLYEAIASRSLFRGANDIETVERVVRLEIPRLDDLRPECPPEVARTIERLLEREPNERWPNAAALLEALEQAAERGNLPLHAGRLRGEMRSLFGDSAPRQPTLQVADDSGARLLDVHAAPTSIGQATRNERAPSAPPVVIVPRTRPRRQETSPPAGTPPHGERRVLEPVAMTDGRAPRPSSSWETLPTRRVDDAPDVDLERFLRLASNSPRAATSPAVARSGVVLRANVRGGSAGRGAAGPLIDAAPAGLPSLGSLPRTPRLPPASRAPFASPSPAMPDRPARDRRGGSDGSAGRGGEAPLIDFDEPAPSVLAPDAMLAVDELIDDELASAKLTDVVSRHAALAVRAEPRTSPPLDPVFLAPTTGTSVPEPGRLAAFWADAAPWLNEPFVLAAAGAAMAAVVLALLTS